MIYRALRWVAGIMLHWFYSDIELVGAENVPSSGSVLIAVNHPNALVDSLIVAWLVPRRVTMTAKATLIENPLIAFVFRIAGVVPLRRAADEKARNGAAADRSRNARSFREIVDVLKRGGAVLIFPEGKSNSEERLAPLKSGLARVALQARREGVKNLSILPLGLTFEDKGAPGSRVRAQATAPIPVDAWPGDDARDLTTAIGARLGNVAGVGAFRIFPASAPEPRSWLVRLAAWWGGTAHDIPVRFARKLAVGKSRNADEPAMLTMLFGAALIVGSYAIHLTVVGLLTRSLLVTMLYLATLVYGAYWRAFAKHQR